MEPEDVFQILCDHLSPKAIYNLQTRDLAISFTHRRINYSITCNAYDEVVACLVKIGFLCFGLYETHRFDVKKFQEEWELRAEQGRSQTRMSSRISVYRKPPTLRDIPL